MDLTTPVTMDQVVKKKERKTKGRELEEQTEYKGGGMVGWSG